MAVRSAAALGPSRRVVDKLRTRRELLAWIFIAPITIIHLVVVVGPGLSGLYFSMTDWSGIGKAEFVGLSNFVDLFTRDVNFRAAFRHNLFWMAFFLTVPMVMALLAASLLSQFRRGAFLIRSFFYMPYVLPSIVSAFTWSMLLNPSLGVGATLDKWGIKGLDHPWLGDFRTALASIAFADNWHWWGFLSILFLTAMQAIPVDLYDAAKIDGANRWQQFRNVTLPGIRPTILFMLLMTAIWSFLSFDYVWILTQGGPAGSSELVSTHLYKQAFLRFEAGYAAAIGMTVSLMAACIVGSFALLRSRGWEI